LRNSFNLGLRVSLRLRYGCQAVALGLLLALDLGPLVGLALRLGVELVLRCLLLGRYAGVVGINDTGSCCARRSFAISLMAPREISSPL
jgi:hypothetical protein